MGLVGALTVFDNFTQKVNYGLDASATMTLLKKELRPVAQSKLSQSNCTKENICNRPEKGGGNTTFDLQVFRKRVVVSISRQQ